MGESMIWHELGFIMNHYAWKNILQGLVEVYHKDSDLPSSIFCSIVLILTWRYIFLSEVWALLKESCFLVPVCVGCDFFFKYDGYRNFWFRIWNQHEWSLNMCVCVWGGGCFIVLLTYRLCLLSLYDAPFPEIPLYKYALTIWRLKFRLYWKCELLSVQETASDL